MNSVHIGLFSSIHQATEMKSSSSIFLLACIVIAFVSAIDEDDSFEGVCMDEVDGTLIENVEDCSSYFKCSKNKAEKVLCMDDTLFDAAKFLCQPPDSVTNCADEKPTHTNDLCPALGAGTFRIPYPGTSEANAFYILCENGKNMGSRRIVRNGSETLFDQPYFRDCPKMGRFKVLDIERPTFYFLCEDGIHLETGSITADTAKELVHPNDLEKKAALEMKRKEKEELESD